MGKKVKKEGKEQSEEEAVKISKLKRKKQIKKIVPSRRSRRLNKIANETKEQKAVIYIGHLPYGFEETGIRKFFEQFGKIVRLIVPRSQKVIRKLIIDCQK